MMTLSDESRPTKHRHPLVKMRRHSLSECGFWQGRDVMGTYGSSLTVNFYFLSEQGSKVTGRRGKKPWGCVKYITFLYVHLP